MCGVQIIGAPVPTYRRGMTKIAMLARFQSSIIPQLTDSVLFIHLVSTNRSLSPLLPTRLAQLSLHVVSGHVPARGDRAMARADFPRTLAEFQDRFASEEDCRRHLVT